jgi:hypothetical protein
VAGCANGLVGIWDLSNGARLIYDHLHGPVVHLHMEANRLHAATALGDFITHDLDAFTKGYCSLMREVWREVDVVWERSLPVARKPPQDHACLKR